MDFSANHSVLRRLAEDEYTANGWKYIVATWMKGYKNYFETDEGDHEDDDEEIDFGSDDEGIGREEVVGEAIIKAKSIYYRPVMFCVTIAWVVIPRRRDIGYLCSICYLEYIDHHLLIEEAEHSHFIDHQTVSPHQVRRYRGYQCPSCQSSLIQVTTRDACIICN